MNLVSLILSFEEREKHPVKNIWWNETSLVLNHFIQLLPQVVENSIIEAQPVDLFYRLNCSSFLRFCYELALAGSAPWSCFGGNWSQNTLDVGVNYAGT